tara:strand:+ start:5314 stop:5532 length:219 start_codon:yes stop_codon:yes gene_type:complete
MNARQKARCSAFNAETIAVNSNRRKYRDSGTYPKTPWNLKLAVKPSEVKTVNIQSVMIMHSERKAQRARKSI